MRPLVGALEMVGGEVRGLDERWIPYQLAPMSPNPQSSPKKITTLTGFVGACGGSFVGGAVGPGVGTPGLVADIIVSSASFSAAVGALGLRWHCRDGPWAVGP